MRKITPSGTRPQVINYKVQSRKPGYDPALAILGQASSMSANNSGLLSAQPTLRILQNTAKTSGTKGSGAELAKIEQLVIIAPEKPAASLWRQIPEGAQLRSLAQKRKLTDKPLRTRIKNTSSTGIVLGLHQPAASFALLTYAGSLAAEALQDNPASVGLLVVGFDVDTESEILNALILALSAHSFVLPSYKSSKAKPPRLNAVRILGASQRIDTKRILAEAEGLNLARWLTALPPNKLDAGSYRKTLDVLAKQHGWKMDFLDEKKLRREGAGAFLAVAQGNAKQDAGIVRLRYQPENKARNKSTTTPLALVGKGIIFDTGGTNLKPFKAMLDMHIDMAGSAVAVATLSVL
jgi:leucyl aminopeptidase